jgi:hypothetical protein
MAKSIFTRLSVFTLACLHACGGDSPATVDAPNVVVDSLSESIAVTIPVNNLPTDRSKLSFAFYDNVGGWSGGAELTGNMVSLRVRSTSFVLAIGCQTGFFIVTVDTFHRVVGDSNPVDSPAICADASTQLVTKISGTVTSVAGSSNTIAIGTDNATVNIATSATTDAYNVSTAPGTVDIFSARLSANGLPETVKVERNFVVGASEITGKNFNLNNGNTPVLVPQTGSKISSVSTTILLRGTKSGDLDVVDPPYSLVGLPSALAKPTDLYQVSATNDDATGAGDVTVTALATQPEALIFGTNLMSAPTINGTNVSYSKVNAAGVEHGGIAIGANASGDIYIEFAHFSTGYIAATTMWPISDFAAVTTWPAVLKAVPAKGRKFTLSATITTGTQGAAGYRIVKHSNRVQIPATMAKGGIASPSASTLRRWLTVLQR